MVRPNIRRNIKIASLCAQPIHRTGHNAEFEEELKHGGKIILPPSTLRTISRIEHSVMIFKIINQKIKRHVFCGVFTFDGEEKNVSLPLWILKQLQIQSGDIVSVEYLTVPLEMATFAKFEPLSKNFLHITDHKTVLEHCMRMYVCISRGDIISICYNRQIYELRICQTIPSDTVLIVDCDLEVDFVRIKEDEREVHLPENLDLDKIQSENAKNSSFKPFPGTGARLDGKKVVQGNSEQVPSQKNASDSNVRKLGVPDYDYKVNSLVFKRHKKDLISNQSSTKPRKVVTKDQSDRKSSVNQQNNPLQQSQQRPMTRSQDAVSRTTENQKNSNQTMNINTNSIVDGAKSRQDSNGNDASNRKMENAEPDDAAEASSS